MSQLVINQLKTLLYRIEASLGSSIFCSLFATIDGVEADILRDGQVSCAVYVSSLLVWAEVLPHQYATVASLEKGLLTNGWQESDAPVSGAVIIWEAIAQADGEFHEHAGFVLNNTEAVSHSDKQRCPIKHHITYGVASDGSAIRKVKKIYIHHDLQKYN